jgi:hypothetical protein
MSYASATAREVNRSEASGMRPSPCRAQALTNSRARPALACKVDPRLNNSSKDGAGERPDVP